MWAPFKRLKNVEQIVEELSQHTADIKAAIKDIEVIVADIRIALPAILALANAVSEAVK